MNPPQLRHTYMQCGAETDRRAQPAHRTEHHAVSWNPGGGREMWCLGRNGYR